jgi:hypothetical protein
MPLVGVCATVFFGDEKRTRAQHFAKESAKQPDLIAEIVKTCRRCGETKGAEEFPPNRRLRDGLHSYCRACMAVYSRRWREQNPGRVAERNRLRRVDPDAFSTASELHSARLAVTEAHRARFSNVNNRHSDLLAAATAEHLSI